MTLKALLLDRITLIWFGLVAATVLSWEFGHGFGLDDYPRLSTVAILMIAFVKVRYVVLDFMEIRAAPRPLRLLLEAWTIVVCVALVALYLAA